MTPKIFEKNQSIIKPDIGVVTFVIDFTPVSQGDIWLYALDILATWNMLAEKLNADLIGCPSRIHLY